MHTSFRNWRSKHQFRSVAAPAVAASRQLAVALLITFTLMASSQHDAIASDHADTHRLGDLGRNDAKIADFYVFTKADNLVMIMTIAAKPADNLADFRFPDDVVYRFLIDRNAEVKPDPNQRPPNLFGGIIDDPASIREDVVIEVTFSDDDADPRVGATGLRMSGEDLIAVYAGVRDDPFIRGAVNRDKSDVAAIAISLPKKAVISSADRQTILAWSTTTIRRVDETNDMDELGARPYRSQSKHELNITHPSKHTRRFGVRPDVVIFDTARTARFPNGRALEDDVVDMLGIKGHEPNPTMNDVPFLSDFPYLAPPHLKASTKLCAYCEKWIDKATDGVAGYCKRCGYMVCSEVPAGSSRGC